jgi:hypothetical protein
MKSEQQIRHALNELRQAYDGAIINGDSQVGFVSSAMVCLAEWVLDLDDPNRKPNFARLMEKFSERTQSN